RYADAARELRAALWAASGWTRTNVELARAEIALGRPAEALSVLRMAYLAPADGMGRYVPHSELDFCMARAFSAAGVAERARLDAGYVRAAWRNADAAVLARMDSLALSPRTR